MSGTKKGGLKARNSNKEKYGPDFYAQIGAIGGKKGKGGGFGQGEEGRRRARKYGAIGGQKGRRGSIKRTPSEQLLIEQQRDKTIEDLRNRLTNDELTYLEYIEKVRELDD